MPRMLLSLLVLGAGLACGGSGSQPAASVQTPAPAENGAWTAVATNGSGQQVLGFSMTMTQGGMGMGGGAMVGMSNLQWTFASGCFGPNTTMTGQAAGGGMGSGMQMTMDMWSEANQTGNHLHMVVTMSQDMETMTGTYTLTGVTQGCASGSGTITMTRKH